MQRMIAALRRTRRSRISGVRLGRLHKTLLTVEEQQLVARINGNRIEQTNEGHS